MSARTLLVTGAVMEITYLTFYLTSDPVEDVALFIGVQAICYLLLTFLLMKTGSGTEDGPDRRTVLVVLAFALLFRLTLVPHPPVASDDIHRYVWDGHVSNAGINPYRYAPEDSALTDLRTARLPEDINFPLMRTIYPPLAQGFFRMSNLIFGPSIAGMKGLFILADMTTILLLFLVLRRQGPFLFGLLAYAWSPVPVLYFALDGHVDSIGIPFLILFLSFALLAQPVRASVALGLAGLGKLYPLFLVPFLLHVKGRVRTLLIPAAMVLAAYLLFYEESGGVYESLLVFNARFEFNGALFSLLRGVGLSGPEARMLCGILFLAWLALLFVLRRPLTESALLGFLGFLLCSPMAHPWYFTWLAALVALRWSPAVFLLVGLTNISNLIVYRYRLTGEWGEDAVTIGLQYLPFIVLFLYEVRKRRILLRPASGAA